MALFKKSENVDSYEKMDFNVLEDKPLTDPKKDEFGHKKIAEGVLDFILNAKPPITIGLYGQWGVGKSSICEFVQRTIERHENLNNKFEIFYFDTWKYERDSFRRQFLIEIDNDLELELKFENLTQSLTKIDKTSGPIKIDFYRIVVVLLWFVCLIFLAAIVAQTASDFFDKESSLITTLVNIFVTVGASSLFFKIVLENIIRTEINTTVNRTDSAEGFEKHFEEILKHEKLKDKKLLVIIDNLDRLEHKKSVELLGDIKTFLASEKNKNVQNNLIFLIPCDNLAIGTHLKVKFGADFNSEEFLRKFFNVSLRIPKALTLELDTYVNIRLRRTGLNDFKNNEPLAFVISEAFRENPRAIIQFINTFTAYYVFAQKEQIKYIVTKENLAFLAKILVLRVKWPEKYNYIEDKILRTGETLEVIIQDLRRQNKDNSDADTEFELLINYLDVTKSIRDDSGKEDLFFSLRESKEQKSLPEWSSFINSAEQLDQANIDKSFERILREDKTKELKALLNTYITHNASKHNKLANVFKGVLHLVDNRNILLFESFISRMLEVLSPSMVYEIFNTSSFEKIFNTKFDQLKARNRKIISEKLTQVISYIGNDTNIKDNLNEAKKFEPYLFLSEAIADKEIWESNFKKHNRDLLEAKHNILNIVDFSKLINDDLKNNDERFFHKIMDYLTVWKPLGQRLYVIIIKHFNDLLEENYTQKSKEIFLRYFLKFLITVEKPVDLKNDVDGQTIVESITREIIKIYNDPAVESDDHLLRKVLYKLFYPENNLADEIEIIISGFIIDRDNTKKEIYNSFSKEDLRRLSKLSEEIRKSLIDRTKFNPTLWYELFPDSHTLSEEEVKEILFNLLSIDFYKFRSFIKYIDYQLNKDTIKEVSLEIFDKLNSYITDILSDSLLVIEKLLGKDDLDIKYLAEKLLEVRKKGGKHAAIVKEFSQKYKKIFKDFMPQSIFKKKKKRK